MTMYRITYSVYFYDEEAELFEQPPYTLMHKGTYKITTTIADSSAPFTALHQVKEMVEGRHHKHLWRYLQPLDVIYYQVGLRGALGLAVYEGEEQFRTCSIDELKLFHRDQVKFAERAAALYTPSYQLRSSHDSMQIMHGDTTIETFKPHNHVDAILQRKLWKQKYGIRDNTSYHIIPMQHLPLLFPTAVAERIVELITTEQYQYRKLTYRINKEEKEIHFYRKKSIILLHTKEQNYQLLKDTSYTPASEPIF